MQVDNPGQIRNVALVGHNDTGKTTLVSALLLTSGVANRLNRVEDGNTVTDFDSEEIGRGISIGLAPCFAPWRGTKINMVDCPGYGIFLTEMRAGLRAVDSALLCINGVAGVQVTTEKAWEYAEGYDMPVMIHLTKMDRENADFERVVSSLQERLHRNVLPLQIPIGAEHDLQGVVDIVHQRAMRFEKDGKGAAAVEDVPADLAERVEEWRTKLMEAVAESDDELMEIFFDKGELSQEELEKGLRTAMRARAVFPVTLSSGLHSIGSSALLDAIVDTLPNPLERAPFPASTVGGESIEVAADAEAPVAALVFKTYNDPQSGKLTLLRVVAGALSSDTPAWNSRAEEQERVGSIQHLQGKQGSSAPSLITGDIGGVAKLKISRTGDTLCAKERPVLLSWLDVPAAAISFAIEPKAKGDEDKIGEALARLMEEDPSLQTSRDPQTGELILSGSGQLHVEIAIAKLKSRSKVEVVLHPPKVPYRETIKKAAEGHGRHKKQTGGRGQFADCKIKMEPLPRGEEFDFVDEIFGGAIPQTYRPAVGKGIQEARLRGFLAGYPVVDFRVRLQDGQYHDVDSSEMAFKIAGSLAFKDAMARANATLLEPIMQIEVTTSEDFMGDIMSDLSQRRGRPQGMEARGTNQVVKALVPMAEILDYAPSLRSMTQGRATFTMELSHYDEVPKAVQEKVIAESKREAAQAG
jgi:elongation factor G